MVSKAIEDRNARDTLTIQSALSFGGTENDWPALYMSIDVSSTNAISEESLTSGASSWVSDDALVLAVEPNVTKYADL